MKIYNNIFGLFRLALLCATIAVTTACNEDTIISKGGDLPPSEGLDSSFGLLRSSRSAGNRVVVRLYKQDVTQNFYFELTQPTTTAVSLKAVADPAFVDVYNAEHKTEIKAFPAAKATIAGGGQVSVVAGKRESAPVSVKFSYDGVDPGAYLLPVVVKELTGGVKPSSEYSVLYFMVFVPGEYPFPGEPNEVYPHDKQYQVVGYVDTEVMQPLVADLFYLELYEGDTDGNEENTYHAWFDIVNLLAATIKYDAVDKRPVLTPHADLRYVLNNSDKYLLPLQKNGQKVCVTIKGGGQGIGFCNLNDAQISDLVFQIKTIIGKNQLDGVNLWDEGSGYGKTGMPAVNTTSYPKFIKALRQALGNDKLITLVDVGDPTATFNVAQAGIEVGDYIDYAWHGYFSEFVNPWIDNSRGRKPIAGLDKNKYGGYAHQSDKLYSEEDLYNYIIPELQTIVAEGACGLVAIDDIPCHKQGSLEGWFISFWTIACEGLYGFYDDGSYAYGWPMAFPAYTAPDGMNEYGGWQKDW